MGRVGDEVPTHRFLPLQRGGHLVERVGEAGQLLRTLSGDARRVVTVGDAARCAADLAQRTRQHPGEEHRESDAGDDGDDRGSDDDTCHGVVVHRRACSAESPASIISSVKTSAPTTATPTARITSPTAALTMAASAIARGDAAGDHAIAASRRRGHVRAAR